MFRGPALSLAEITWRWCFGAGACVLAGFATLEYLDTLPVSNRDLFLLRSGMPSFVMRALAHILHGSAARFLLAGLIVGAAASLLWILLATLGRAATLAPLLQSIRARARSFTQGEVTDPTVSAASTLNHTIVNPEVTNAEEIASAADTSAHHLRSLAGLHFLRVMIFGLAVLACAGALFAAGLLSPHDDPHPGIAFLAFFSLGSVIFLAVTALNWLLSLATLYVVRDGEDSFGAISSAINLCQDRLGAVLAVGIWFGLAHLTFFLMATSIVGFPLSFLTIVPPGFVLIAMTLITLAYLAVADSLYIGRLAGYAAILEAPAIPSPTQPAFDATPTFAAAPASAGTVPQFASSMDESYQAPSAAVDQSELILGDTSAESHTPMQDPDTASEPPKS